MGTLLISVGHPKDRSSKKRSDKSISKFEKNGSEKTFLWILDNSNHFCSSLSPSMEVNDHFLWLRKVSRFLAKNGKRWWVENSNQSYSQSLKQPIRNYLTLTGAWYNSLRPIIYPSLPKFRNGGCPKKFWIPNFLDKPGHRKLRNS